MKPCTRPFHQNKQTLIRIWCHKLGTHENDVSRKLPKELCWNYAQKLHTMPPSEHGKKFREKNPFYIKGNGCMYVGQSSRKPKLRFDQHKEGYKSNKYAKVYGERLINNETISKDFLNESIKTAKSLAPSPHCTLRHGPGVLSDHSMTPVLTLNILLTLSENKLSH